MFNPKIKVQGETVNSSDTESGEQTTIVNVESHEQVPCYLLKYLNSANQGDRKIKPTL